MTAALPVRWKNRGGKAPAAYLRGSYSRTINTAPKNYDCDENDCAPSRQGARPARQVPRTVSIRSGGGRAFAAAHPKRQAPAEALRDEVATMRARNTMRFSAPTREPPGGRPSRGAKLKGRGCTRQKDAVVRTLRLGGTGAAKKAPSEQGATKAAGLGAEDARLEPRQWSAAERLSRDRRRKRRCCARPPTEKSARSSAFFLLALVIALRTPRQAQEAATQGTPISPSVFIALDVRWAKMLSISLKLIDSS